MSSSADKLLKANQKIFRALRKQFFKISNELIEVYLLRKIGETDEYEILFQPADWYLNYEESRAQTRLRIAQNDDDFLNAYQQMSDFAVINSKNVGTIYAVDKRDKEEPQGNAFYYAMFGVNTGERWFVPVV